VNSLLFDLAIGFGVLVFIVILFNVLSLLPEHVKETLTAIVIVLLIIGTIFAFIYGIFAEPFTNYNLDSSDNVFFRAGPVVVD